MVLSFYSDSSHLYEKEVGKRSSLNAKSCIKRTAVEGRAHESVRIACLAGVLADSLARERPKSI